MTKKKESLVPRFCEICGTSIDVLPINCKVCSSDSCRKERTKIKARENYKKNLKEKVCKKCNNLFLATQKQTCCENCRDSRKDNRFKQVEQNILCWKCGIVLETVLKNKTKDIPENINGGLCKDCKKETTINRSNYMKLNNPMYDPDIAKKSGEIKKGLSISKEILVKRNNLTLEEYNQLQLEKQIYNSDENKLLRKQLNIENLKHRMIYNNPMFNEETKLKFSNTIKEKIKSGEIVYKKGIENPLYKGNRNFNKQVRIELRQWVKEMMEKEEFTCKNCGKTNCSLQIHHTEPLRDIISKFLQKHNTNILDLELGSNICLNILSDIKQYHYDTNPGICVCEDCHTIIDKHYKKRRLKNEN